MRSRSYRSDFFVTLFRINENLIRIIDCERGRRERPRSIFIFLYLEYYPDDKYINRCILRSHPVKFFVKKNVQPISCIYISLLSILYIYTQIRWLLLVQVAERFPRSFLRSFGLGNDITLPRPSASFHS